MSTEDKVVSVLLVVICLVFGGYMTFADTKAVVVDGVGIFPTPLTFWDRVAGVGMLLLATFLIRDFWRSRSEGG